jgi:hypothetical protein
MIKQRLSANLPDLQFTSSNYFLLSSYRYRLSMLQIVNLCLRQLSKYCRILIEIFWLKPSWSNLGITMQLRLNLT